MRTHRGGPARGGVSNYVVEAGLDLLPGGTGSARNVIESSYSVAML